MLSGLMFDTETQRNGYMWVVDYSGMTSKEMLFMDQAYVEMCARIDELAMAGLPLICNKVLHINVPRALASVLTFCRLVFPKNGRDWLIVASEKQVLELVGGVEALPRWFGSGQGQCDGCDRFTALSMAQLNSMFETTFASWVSGDSAAHSVSLPVPVPQIHARGGTDGKREQPATIALSMLDSAAVCRALQLSGVATDVVEAVRADDLDGRALAEVDDEYLKDLDSSLGNGSGGAARLKRQSFLRSARSVCARARVCMRAWVGGWVRACLRACVHLPPHCTHLGQLS